MVVCRRARPVLPKASACIPLGAVRRQNALEPIPKTGTLMICPRYRWFRRRRSVGRSFRPQNGYPDDTPTAPTLERTCAIHQTPRPRPMCISRTNSGRCWNRLRRAGRIAVVLPLILSLSSVLTISGRVAQGGPV